MVNESSQTLKRALTRGAVFSFLACASCATLCSPPRTQGAEGVSRNIEASEIGKEEAASPPDVIEPPPASLAAVREKPTIKKIRENTYRIGQVMVDTKQRVVTFPAQVNLREGVLEVLICTQYGKTHESLLTTKVSPLHLNVAFLLLGLEGGNAVKYQGHSTKPTGSPVQISFKFKKGDKERVIRAEDWVYNNHTKRPMLHTHWVYVGSVVTENGFMAQRQGQIVTTFHDPFTLIDNPLPGGADDTIYIPYTRVLPPLGTPVTVLIKPLPHDRKSHPSPLPSQ